MLRMWIGWGWVLLLRENCCGIWIVNLSRFWWILFLRLVKLLGDWFVVKLYWRYVEGSSREWILICWSWVRVYENWRLDCSVIVGLED